MKLSTEQRALFEREGYLFFPGLFTPEETRTMTDAVPTSVVRGPDATALNRQRLLPAQSRRDGIRQHGSCR